MAASRLLISGLVDAVPLWFATCMAMIADRSGTAVSRWCLDVRTTRSPVFSRIKWLLASMGGTLSARRVQLALGRVLHCKVKFRCADRTVMAASYVCSLSRPSAIVISKAAIADRNGTAASWLQFLTQLRVVLCVLQRQGCLVPRLRA